MMLYYYCKLLEFHNIWHLFYNDCLLTKWIQQFSNLLPNMFHEITALFLIRPSTTSLLLLLLLLLRLRCLSFSTLSRTPAVGTAWSLSLSLSLGPLAMLLPPPMTPARVAKSTPDVRAPLESLKCVKDKRNIHYSDGTDIEVNLKVKTQSLSNELSVFHS